MSGQHGSRSIGFTNPSAEEVVRERAEACQSLVDIYLSSATRLSISELIDSLRHRGASTDEVEDYVSQFELRRISKAGKAREKDAADEEFEIMDPPTTPEGLSESQAEEYRQKRDTITRETAIRDEDDERQRREAATNSVAWANLRARIQSLRPSAQGTIPLKPHTSSNTFQTPKDTAITGGIPSSVLAFAPHLQVLSIPVEDQVLARTWELRRVFSAESKIVDSIVDAVQTRNLLDPLPRSVWKDIIQDRLVDFEKLHACLTQPGYDLHDDPKDFASSGEYILVRKDQTNARKPVQTSSEWTRLFAAWEAGVLVLYPHRAGELSAYSMQVNGFFRTFPDNPAIGIVFDSEVREDYSRGPFRMDDQHRTHLHMLSAFSKTYIAPSVTHSGTKRLSNSSSIPLRKKQKVICINWNLGLCTEPCPGNRIHSICSECNGKHRAKDSKTCLITVQARDRSRGSTTVRGSGTSIGGS